MNQGNYTENCRDYFDNRQHFYFESKPNDENQAIPKRDKNQKTIIKEVRQEVKDRLCSSLHSKVEALINLDKQEQPEKVKGLQNILVKMGSLPCTFLPPETRITKIFDHEVVDGRLLILGLPGSGKTTIMLELAEKLLIRAENNPEFPIPVLFELSSWNDNNQTIMDWLVTELDDRWTWGTSNWKELLKNRQLIPMLDGLDELEPMRQEFCVQAINQFLNGEYSPDHLVVCSRSEELDRCETQLLLRSAIYLHPLTDSQIGRYFKNFQKEELWNSIRNNTTLLEIVRTPLFLSFAASSRILIDDWDQQKSYSERISYLIEAYIIDRISWGKTKTNKIQAYSNGKKQPTTKQIRYWLSWLALKKRQLALQKRQESYFFIDRMQPFHWLDSNQLILIYKIIAKIIFWIPWLIIIEFTMKPLIDSSVGDISQLIVLLLFVCIIQFSNSFLNKSLSYIKPVETIYWKYIFRIVSLKPIILVLLLFLISFLNSSISSGIIYSLLMLIFLDFISDFVCFWIIYGGKGEDIKIEKRKYSNQGIYLSAINATIMTLVVGISMWGWARWIFPSWGIDSHLFALSLGLLAGVIGSLRGGSSACIKHFTLRLTLWLHGYIPWNYSRFLNYATEIFFLQRVGGGYRFIHRQLQDHFADTLNRQRN